MQQIVVFVFLAFAGVAFAASYETQNSKNKANIEPFVFEDIINGTIESIRPDIPETLSVPSLYIELPDDVEILKGTANLSNLELTGLKGFQVTSLNLDLFSTRLNFTLVFPSINLNLDYLADVTLLNLIPIYGKGRANIHILVTEIEASARANLTGGISVSQLRFQLYLESATFDVHGLLDNEDFSNILSQVLNDVVTSFIDDHQEAISNILSPVIEIIINTILAGNDLQTTTSEDINVTTTNTPTIPKVLP